MIYSHAGHDIDLPLPRIRHFGEAGIGILPEIEEFLPLLFLLIHRKVHLAQQFLEAWVGAQGITKRFSDVRQVGATHLVGLF